MITFDVPVPESFDSAEIEDWLARQGYTRTYRRSAEAPGKGLAKATGADGGRREVDAQASAGEEGSAGGRRQRTSPVPTRRRSRPSASCRTGCARARRTADASSRRSRRRSAMAGGRVTVHVLGEDREPLRGETFSTQPRLRTLRHPLPRAAAERVLVQLADGRLRELPGVRTDHRHRLPPGDPRHLADARGRRRQGVPDRQLRRLPARHGARGGSAPASPLTVPFRPNSPSRSASGVIRGEGRVGSATRAAAASAAGAAGTASRASSTGSRARPTACTCA